MLGMYVISLGAKTDPVGWNGLMLQKLKVVNLVVLRKVGGFYGKTTFLIFLVKTVFMTNSMMKLDLWNFLN